MGGEGAREQLRHRFVRAFHLAREDPLPGVQRGEVGYVVTSPE